MSRRGGGRSPVWLVSAAGAVAVAVLAVFTNVATAHLPSWAWLSDPVALWGAVGLFVAATVAIAVAQTRSADRSTSRLDVDGAARLLREMVLVQWRQELSVRQIFDQLPLQVHWSLVSHPVIADTAVPDRGHLDTLVDRFRVRPQQQLVVLGQPGAGKSVFAALFTVRLLGEQVDEEAAHPELRAIKPVPVLLPVADWDPRDHLDRWISRRLIDEYAFLAGPDPAEPRRTLAEALVSAQPPRLLPVLDGLDEMPADQHQQAIEGLRRAVGRPLVLTGRSGQYLQAVGLAERPLAAATIVELLSVGPSSARDFLAEPAHPQRLQRWQPVLDQLDRSAAHPAEAPGAVVEALSTPLMVHLAQVAYRSRESTPAELLELPDRAAVEERLIASYLESLYPERAENTVSAPPGGRALRRYPATSAMRWLTTVAVQSSPVYEFGAGEFVWWRLDPGLFAARPRRARRALTLIVGAGTALFAGLAGAVAGGFGMGFRAAVVGALAPILVTTDQHLAILRSRSHPSETSGDGPAGPPRRWAEWSEQLQIGLACGLTAYVITGEGSCISSCPAAVLFCHLIRIISGQPSTPFGRGSADHRPPRPRESARAAVLAGLSCGLAAALATLFLLTFYPAAQISTDSAAAGITTAVFVGMSDGGWVWIRYRLTHLIFVARGRLPLHLENFLEDAHRRGALRRTGNTWQLRHALLQKHLLDANRLALLRARADAGERLAKGDLVRLLVEEQRMDELSTRADCGDAEAAGALVVVLIADGRVEEAIEFARARAPVDDGAVDRLTRLLVEQERVNDAIAVLQAHVDSGSPMADSRLTRLLVDQDRVDDAITRLRDQADAGGFGAAVTLAHLLAEYGRLPELRDRAASGDTSSSSALNRLLAQLGREAELEARVEAGDRIAADALAQLLVDQGRHADAIRALGRSSHHSVSWQLADLLAAEERVDEAIAVLQPRVKSGDRYAAAQLARLLAGQGRMGEATDTLWRRARIWRSTARAQLHALLTDEGRLTGLTARADADDWYAERCLDRLLAERGRVDDLRRRTDFGRTEPARQLAELLVRRGEVEDAIAVLRQNSAGDWACRRQLATLLADRGSVDEARKLFTALADAGDPSAADKLPGLALDRLPTAEPG